MNHIHNNTIWYLSIFDVYLKKSSIFFLGKTSGIISNVKMLSPKTVEFHYIKIVHIGLHSLEF